MDSMKQHIISRIKAILKQWATCFFLLSCLPNTSWCQEGLSILIHNEQQVIVEYQLKNLTALPCDNGHALLTSPATNSHRLESGLPMLPQQRQLLAIANNKLEIRIDCEDWDTLSLNSIGCNLPMAHYSGASAKETLLTPIPTNKSHYSTDSLMGAPLVSIRPLGLMRNTPLAELTISPVLYNPAHGTIAVCRKVRATISSGGDTSIKSLYNPMFNSLPIATPHNSKDYLNTLALDSTPQLYQVVAATQYRETLQPLLSWKRQEGYLVDELYFDQGNTNEVKDSLQSRFDNPSPKRPAPLFILLVGDMSDILLWTPRHPVQGLETHRTDFYYAEFTGDMLPDAMIGRISVNDTTQLRHVVDKTIAYEKGLIADTAALRRSLLVAGKEETYPAPIVTNGQVNYVKNLIMAHDPNHDTICFYNPESTNRREDILDALRNGVALTNYTSHCTSKGWRDPILNNNDINNTDVTDNHPHVSINNCCRSNDVAGNCFGEQLLRKENGGAVGTIGATNETLWDEDYYWSVGFGNITTTPSPDSSSAGAFDRLLHPHLQPASEQSWTLGQMMLAGNCAVTASGSQFADFYWEIYLLLGDPSLMPHIGPLHPLHLYCDSVQPGDTILSLAGTPWARVAATCGDTLMGLCTLDANGEGVMHFRQPVASNICITATRQFHKAKQIFFTLIDDSSTENVEITPKNNITIYPNPASNQFTVNGLDCPATIAIYDCMGRLVMQKSVSDGKTVTLHDDMSNGIYTLMLTLPDKTKTFRKLLIRD